MKKTILLLLSVITVLISCTKLPENPLNTKKGLKGVQNIIETSFGQEKEVYSLEVSCKDFTNNSFGSSTIKYLEDGLDYSRKYWTYWGEIKEGTELEDPIKKNDALQKDFHLKNIQGKFKIKDVNYDLILKKYEEALKTIPNDYENIIFSNFIQEANNDNDISIKFYIVGTKKGEKKRNEGRKVITNYYSFPFEIADDGALIILEE